jgi:lysylphosphatidylglycerol synthetase-like protein (DUF2156 family)
VDAKVTGRFVLVVVLVVCKELDAAAAVVVVFTLDDGWDIVVRVVLVLVLVLLGMVVGELLDTRSGVDDVEGGVGARVAVDRIVAVLEEEEDETAVTAVTAALVSAFAEVASVLVAAAEKEEGTSNEVELDVLAELVAVVVDEG